MKIRQTIAAIAVLLLTTQFALADTGKALINADYVRVREKPNKDAAQIGFLYKNMAVEIQSKTPAEEAIGNESFPWYEVKGKEVSGWVYGKFLTTNVAQWDVDTYDAPGDMQWLYARFGESTWYYNQTMSMQSFSIDDYRNLMRAAEEGSEQAWIALRITILQHLYEEPDDPNYAYLKKRLYSAEFIKAILNQPYAQSYRNAVFDLVPYSRELLLAVLTDHSDLVASMPDSYWKDREIVRLVAKGPSRCQFVYEIFSRFPNDPEFEQDLASCRRSAR